MKKVVVVLALIFALAFAGGSALAAPLETQPSGIIGIVPALDLVQSINPGLSVSGTTASYSVSVSGALTVTSINVTLQLQTKNSNGTWSNYGSSWTASAQTCYFSTNGTKTVAAGATYRLAVTVTTSDGKTTSTTTAYSA